MYTFLLALHIICAILFLGPVTVAVSGFGAQALKAHEGSDHARGTARLLHKITATYGILSALVPAIGVALMFTDPDNYWKQGRFHASIVLSIVAWVLLIIFIIPRQKRVLGALSLLDEGEQEEAEAEGEATVNDWPAAKKQLSIMGGVFCLLWVLIAVLMFTTF